MDANGDDTAAAKIAFVQREVCRQDNVAGGARVLFADQPTEAVVGIPGGQFFAMALGGARRAVGDRNARCADMLSLRDF